VLIVGGRIEPARYNETAGRMKREPASL
jgi:hypothetical protein